MFGMHLCSSFTADNYCVISVPTTPAFANCMLHAFHSAALSRFTPPFLTELFKPHSHIWLSGFLICLRFIKPRKAVSCFASGLLLTARRRRAVLALPSVFLNRGKRFLALLAVYFFF